jgi:hypothetical protein
MPENIHDSRVSDNPWARLVLQNRKPPLIPCSAKMSGCAHTVYAVNFLGLLNWHCTVVPYICFNLKGVKKLN